MQSKAATQRVRTPPYPQAIQVMLGLANDLIHQPARARRAAVFFLESFDIPDQGDSKVNETIGAFKKTIKKASNPHLTVEQDDEVSSELHSLIDQLASNWRAAFGPKQARKQNPLRVLKAREAPQPLPKARPRKQLPLKLSLLSTMTIPTRVNLDKSIKPLIEAMVVELHLNEPNADAYAAGMDALVQPMYFSGAPPKVRAAYANVRGPLLMAQSALEDKADGRPYKQSQLDQYGADARKALEVLEVELGNLGKAQEVPTQDLGGR